MLNNKEIEEIREHLEKSGNPLFFFDNDADGLASFLLLARKYRKGKGVAIKGADLNSSYLRKIEELNPDYIFVLDKPLISKEFLDAVKEKNLPLVWIDHHKVLNPISAIGNSEDFSFQDYLKNLNYYNPAVKKNGNEPVTYLCWKIADKKDDLWLAMAGCIADSYLPEFKDDFSEKYPELWKDGIKTAFQAFYETGIGKIARILNFCLKDKTNNVIRMIKFLLLVKTPSEISDENEIFARFKYIEKKYLELIERAKKYARNKLLYFQYSGELSISSDISNELIYRFPDKTIIVVYIKGTRANISIRGRNIRETTEKAVLDLKNATGGGHDDASGAKINLEDLTEFRRRFEELIE